MNRTAAAIAVIILISIVIECSSKTTVVDNNQYEHELEQQDDSDTDQHANKPPEKMSKDAPLVPGCPLCDSSVFSYCDVKIYHDACCCGLSLPQCMYQQQQEGCHHLHANSCQDHHLITRCCCYNPQYRKIE